MINVFGGLVVLLTKRGLYVGRFQPFHLGHLKAIKYALSKVDELIIVVGSAQYSHSQENLFTCGERITMIRLALNEAEIDPSRYYIIPVPDTDGVHSLWVSLVASYTPCFNIVFTNEPLTRRLFIEAGYAVEPIPYYHREVYSATEVRRRMLTGEGWRGLVPKSIEEFIKNVKGVERLCELLKKDKIS